ncbi:MAG: hypothetical protein E6J34_23090 [Chloroflexi bacterium]|nr:MAG: hypothetical protein E6J34_23090 [Chloroflexota bacterium]
MTSNNQSIAQPLRVVILTALPLEYDAVRAHLSNLQEEVHSTGTIYEKGTFGVSGCQWQVCIAEVGAGNQGAAIETERAIEHFKPHYVLFVGVAGGIKDVAIGDVVCATKVYGYESGKAEQIFLTRPVVWSATHTMEQRAKAEARKQSWLERLRQLGYPVPEPAPRVIVAPIAAGEKVVASKDADAYHLIRRSYNDAVAVEMEAVGFLQAGHTHQEVHILVIRGISDLIEGKDSSADQQHQPMAARHASAFAFEILAKLTPARPIPTPVEPTITSAPTNNTNTHADKEQQMPTSSNKPTDTFEVFYSFTHEDRSYADKLHKHLILLKREGLITESFAGEITLGGDTNKVKPLDTADIIFLLISEDFLVSEETYDVQMQRAMARHRNGQLQALPRDKKPISSFRDMDEAFAGIAREIRAAIKKIKGK